MDDDAIADLFSAFGPVARRRMFGGAGLYADGLMFAIEVAGTIYLKADTAFAAELGQRGSAPFSYLARGVVRTMNGFWSVPEAALDDGDDLAALARHSLALARAAAAQKPGRAVAAKRAGAPDPAMAKGAGRPAPKARTKPVQPAADRPAATPLAEAQPRPNRSAKPGAQKPAVQGGGARRKSKTPPS